MLDYKDVSFSFRDRKIRRRRRRLRLVLLAFLVLAAFLGYRYLRARSAVAEVQDLLLAGRAQEAEQRLRALGTPWFLRGNVRELQALSELFQGRLSSAAARLEKLRQDESVPLPRSAAVLEYFFNRGEYQKLKIYTDYLLPRGGDEAGWFHALVQAAFLNPAEAEKAAAGLSPAFRKANLKALALLSQFNHSLRSGRIDYIFDRNDVPLAYFDLRRRSTRSLVPGMEFGNFDAQFRQGARRYRLTLDAELQKKADLLFRGYFGTLVLLDLPENGIAVSYSKPRSGRAANTAFSERFAPGSIVKLVSLLAFLRRNEGGVFPLECPGLLPVGNKVIYDLIRHGHVRDYSQALAESCNVAFTRMGQAVGFAGLTDMLRRFSFNAPPFTDQFCDFALGRFNLSEGDDLQLANLAAGMGNVSLTTIHAAVLTAAFSQNGQLFPPYLIDDAKNILGLGFYSRTSRPQRVLDDDLNFLRVKKAMTEVVESQNGTGRRARSTAVRLAIKTGTASNPAGGMDAVIAGFFPYEKPRYAFAFRLEGGGRADVEGARFLRALLDALRLS